MRTARNHHPLESHHHYHHHHNQRRTSLLTISPPAIPHAPSQKKTSRHKQRQQHKLHNTTGVSAPLKRFSRTPHRLVHASVDRHCCDVVLVQDAGEVVRVADVRAKSNSSARAGKIGARSPFPVSFYRASFPSVGVPATGGDFSEQNARARLQTADSDAGCAYETSLR